MPSSQQTNKLVYIWHLHKCPLLYPLSPILAGMCNVRVTMTLSPAASCSPGLNHSRTWTGNIIFVSIRDAPYVQSVIGTLSPLQRRLKVGTSRGWWVTLLVWVWAGQWGVKGDVFGLSPHADSTWFSLADLVTPSGCRAAVLAYGCSCYNGLDRTCVMAVTVSTITPNNVAVTLEMFSVTWSCKDILYLFVCLVTTLTGKYTVPQFTLVNPNKS